MSISYLDYVNTVKSRNTTRKVKIELLNSTEQIIGTISPRLLDGSVSKNSEYCRRTATLTLENSDGSLIPSSSLFWINSKLKLYTGYEINGEEYYVSQGVFLVGEPQLSSELSNLTLSLNLYDKMEKLSGLFGGTLKSEYIINVGEPVNDVIKNIFLAAGEIKTPILEPNDIVTPYTITQEPGSTYLDLIKTICEMSTYTCFYDELGYPRFEPPVSIDTEPSIWDFKTSEINYSGANRRYTYSDVKNTIVVRGDNINGSTYTATAQDTNLSSDTRVSLIGEIVKYIEDSNIYSNDLCQARADYELLQSTALIETINFNAVIVDHLETQQICTITDSGIDLNQDRYLIKSLSLPLVNNGNMTGELWKSRNLS
jgi:hypothetical protein